MGTSGWLPASAEEKCRQDRPEKKEENPLNRPISEETRRMYDSEKKRASRATQQRERGKKKDCTT